MDSLVINNQHLREWRALSSPFRNQNIFANDKISCFHFVKSMMTVNTHHPCCRSKTKTSSWMVYFPGVSCFSTMKPNNERSCRRSDTRTFWWITRYFVIIWFYCHHHRNLLYRQALSKSSLHLELMAMWHCDHTSPSTLTSSHQELVTSGEPAQCTSYFKELIHFQMQPPFPFFAWSFSSPDTYLCLREISYACGRNFCSCHITDSGVQSFI